MSMYIARQPIYNRHRRLYGYELLYRSSANNYYEGNNENQATISLINDTLMVFGFHNLVDHTLGFINVPEAVLQSNLIYMLPKEHTVIEILETVRPTKEVIAACKQLKAKGYRLALDDFVLNVHTIEYREMIDLADIIKVEFPKMIKKDIGYFIKHLNHRVVFLAEKIETKADFDVAMNLGFSLFQGYYLGKPLMHKTKDIGIIDGNLLQILNEIRQPEVNFQQIAFIIGSDVGLTYKLLKMANSVQYEAKFRIKLISQGLLLMGIEEIRRWVNLMILRGFERPDNTELIKTCMIRSSLLFQIATLVPDANDFDYFVVGIFSEIDVLLQAPMAEAIRGLLLSDQVSDALLKKDNQIRQALDLVQCFELGNWDDWNGQIGDVFVSAEECTSMYLKALQWYHTLMV